MKSHYWLKLYHEILDDAKMGRLPDRLWRRTIELFLMAGEEHDGGHLPPLEDMAWRLRLNDDELRQDLEALAQIEIVTQLDNGMWFVTNFAERQSAMSNAERQQRYRDRKRKDKYYCDDNETEESQDNNGTVTECNADIDIDKDTDVDTKIDTNDGAEAPATPPSQRNGSPHHLRGWLELIRESKNRPATSRRMIEALYPYYTEADLPGYGRIGATAKRVSGWGRLIQYIWGLSQYEPQGDLMSYIETVHKNGGKASGDAQGDYGDFDFGG